MTINFRLKSLLMISAALVLTAALSLTAYPDLAEAKSAQGKLYLVGLGSGDPDNMTIRAHKIITKADVILGMKYVEEKYKELFKGKQFHDAGHMLFVDKSIKVKGLDKKRLNRLGSPEKLKARQEKIRRIVRESVAKGKIVAVVAGGDPMLFSPHTGFLEEFADLKPEVVPGLSCFNAANAALKVSPNKGYASHSVILTSTMPARMGYKGKDTLEALGKTQSSMVFFTMRLDLPAVVADLKKNYPGNTPIAIVLHAGYRDREKVKIATLDTILDQLKDKKLPFEHLIYVGDFLK
ncbi:SAM-dependent methyltransferase [Dethiosulfatarculus sandiegensis]|uniref:Uroporphyrin-III C-methyltransferase n=1 Tax=Dethiosulfatarculus sandiegensis TaxID=1429043 RepID=A0A0D2J7Z4_9BACT|nr:SAM-dependent methyltransferase [Dethiosulfatarculus sandiegensis]KIX11841.1 uroporphyrin-III C-methyltransferase [Dethiosulfatarculus sandiegensis]